MKYFITGATGFIGGALARLLVARGHQVVALVRSPEKARDLKALGVELAQGDITVKETMRAPMTGADGVYHVAGWYKLGRRQRAVTEAVNIDGTRNVLELMRDLAVPKGVYTSTLAVFSDTHGQMPDETYRFTGTHLSEYDRTKAAAHYDVALPMMRAGLPLVIVQPGVVYGPGDTSALGGVIRSYLQGRLPFAPGRTTLAWGYIDDIAEAHGLAMDKGAPGESYIIAGPAHPFVDMFRLAQQITEIPAPRLVIPPAMMKLTAGLMGLIEPIIDLPESYTAEALRSSAGVTYLGTNAKAKRELGYAPRSLEDGLRLTLAYEMERLGINPKT